MKFANLTCLAIVAVALGAAPAITQAADTNTPAATAPAKKHNPPYHGKVTAVDATAMTFTLGTNTVTVSSTTKITKDGKAAVFSDITVGETVGGIYKKDTAGKFTALTVRIGEAKKKVATPAPDAPAK